MRGDFSRLPLDLGGQYNRPLLQQGRVLLDADFNTLGATVAASLRGLIRDLLGPHAGPADAAGNVGFAVAPVSGRLAIGYGRYYVDGLLAANDAPAPNADGNVAPLFFDDQSGYPYPGGVAAADFKQDQPYLLYLDVWEHFETWFERGVLREVALGGRTRSGSCEWPGR